jgi:hypothetical protein
VTSIETQELVSFLVNCSRASLGNFLLAKQNQASNLERNLRDITRELIETVAFIELANILREHGEEIVGGSHGPRSVALAAFPKAGPVKVKPPALVRGTARSPAGRTRK